MEGYMYIIQDSKVLGGIPIIKDTRLPVSTLIMELCNGKSMIDIASQHDLEYSDAYQIMHEAVRFVAEVIDGMTIKKIEN